MPWSLNTCSTQRSPVHRVQLHGAFSRGTHLYPPHNNSSVFLTTTTYCTCGGVGGSSMERGVGGQPHKTPHFNSIRRYTPRVVASGGAVVPNPPFEICAPLSRLAPWFLHTSDIVFQKCGRPFWFLAPPSGFWSPLLLNPGDGPVHTHPE